MLEPAGAVERRVAAVEKLSRARYWSHRRRGGERPGEGLLAMTVSAMARRRGERRCDSHATGARARAAVQRKCKEEEDGHRCAHYWGFVLQREGRKRRTERKERNERKERKGQSRGGMLSLA